MIRQLGMTHKVYFDHLEAFPGYFDQTDGQALPSQKLTPPPKLIFSMFQVIFEQKYFWLKKIDLDFFFFCIRVI